ncbi:MAG: hypothetical protein KBD76_08100 [Bacteriovorax sp.]|nr:hypothetical protein [Bacteriovorax sp.]
MELTILGAAREVTDSYYLFERDKVRFLVDCGMVQGRRDSRKRNHYRLRQFTIFMMENLQLKIQ